MKNKILMLLSLFFLNNVPVSANTHQIPETQENVKAKAKYTIKRRPSIKAMSIGAHKAMGALQCNPLDECSVWDKNYLKRDPELTKIITEFHEGNYAQKVKNFNFENKTKEQIIDLLLKENFTKKDAVSRVDGLLGRAKDTEVQDSGEIYIHNDGSMVRIKDNSLDRKHRPQAYVVKAVLKNPTGQVSWQNEAFKVSKEGIAIPKGPRQIHGLKIHAPNTSGTDEDKGWVDLIMEEAHIDLPAESLRNNP